MDFALKVMKKLGHGHGAYKLLRPAYSKAHRLDERLTPETALEFLHGVSPDAGSSCLTGSVEAEKAAWDLDIIIPAYNVEAYIKECIDSVLSQQTGYSYRVIVIDDGSTDSTGKILDEYSGITVVHQENRGFSGARNTGLRLATADYVMFLDSDDCLCKGTIDRLMNAAKIGGACIAEGGYTEVDSDGKALRCHPHKDGKQAPTECNGYFWGKVLKRELFNAVELPQNYWYEDSLLRQIIYPLAMAKNSAAVGISENTVLYRQNRNSITRKAQGKPKSLDSLYITLKLYEDRQRLGLKNTEEYYDYILNMASQTYSRTKNLGDEVQQAIFVVYMDFIKKNLSDYKTQNAKLACLEKAILSGDYGSYLAYCKLH